jgi:signal recognition particle subunit SRP72
LKHLGGEAVQDKLTTAQKKSIFLNRCVLLLLMNKNDECRELLKLFEAEFPQSEFVPIILSSLQYRDRKVQKAEQILKEWIDANPKNCTRAQLSLAQLYFSQDNITAVVETLESIETLKQTPAMVTTLARLCEQTGDLEAAIKILDEGFERVSKADDDSTAQIMKKSADFKIKNKLFREAAVTLEKILKGSPNDTEALPKLVIALASVDPVQAERYATRLPEVTPLDSADIDVDKLENVQGPQFARKERAEAVATVAGTDQQQKKLKKKRKRKNPPAKKADFTKPADPERWLPRKERSTYKPRRVKGGASKGSTRSSGAQGNVQDSAAQTS